VEVNCLKVELKENAAFISHNGVTIFFNKYTDRKTHKQTFMIRVTKEEFEPGNGLRKRWHVVAEMFDVSREAYDKLCTVLNQLVFNGAVTS